MTTVINSIAVGSSESANYTGSLTTFTEGTDVLTYDVYSAQGNGLRTIKYENSRWVDANTSDQPILMDSTFTTVITSTVLNPQYVYMTWYGSNKTMINPYYNSGGGPPVTLSYQGTLTVNGANLDYDIPNAATTGNYHILSKVLPGGMFFTEIPIAHTAYNGGSSGSAINYDATKQWILRAPDGTVLDSAGATPGNKKVFRNFW